ncbi:ABC transporter permease [Myceligenerans indicum]|uniref:ABC transporter permease n=1 Tax=Myceligenerans indicum TaxID=2593663 RepID=A0ABS1LFF9_9MICO|nr:ABC transporter permease [Myceligenerans indicum]MBL0884982.1 ABC transporter permease [Myceligenerans indicum]
MSDTQQNSSGWGPGASDVEELVPEAKSYSANQLVVRRFFRHRGAIVAMITLAAVIVVAFTSIGVGPIPGWWNKDIATAYDKVGDGSPTWAHPFGQNTIGKDYFALTMRGTQVSLYIAFGVGLVSTLIGTLVGAIAGYFRGILDSLLMRLTDVVIIIPLLAIAAVLGRMTGGDVNLLVLALGVLTWTSLARLVRGEVLSLRERDFVMAARAVGTHPVRIIVRHILPNTVGVVIVSATLTIAAAILLETALSFLGFGVQTPDVSLGSLISEYKNAFTTRPWLFWWPGLMILAIALSVNFIGDGLRDAFDPRQTSTKE